LNLLDVLNQLIIPMSLNDLLSKYDFNEDVKSFIDFMANKYFLVTEDCDERDILRQAIAARNDTLFKGGMATNFSLVISEACNFCCTYCIHFSNLGVSGRLHAPTKIMTPLVAEKSIDAFWCSKRKT